MQRPRFLLTPIPPFPLKAYSNILRDSWDSREIITLVYSSDAARNVPTPSPLTTLLRRICYSLFLSIRVCDPKIENMFFCPSVGKTHRSSLTTHWSKSVVIRRIRVICVPIATPYPLTTHCQIFLLLSTKRILVPK